MNKKGYVKTLKSFECKSDKALDAPLAKKSLAVKLEQPIMDILESLPTVEKVSLIRRAIAKELVAEGLLQIPNQ